MKWIITTVIFYICCIADIYFFMIGWWWGTRWSRAYRNKRKKGKYLTAIKIFHILRQRGVLWNKIFKNGPSIIIWRLSLKNWYVMVFLEAVFHNLCLLHFTILWHFWSYLPPMLHFFFFFFFCCCCFQKMLRQLMTKSKFAYNICDSMCLSYWVAYFIFEKSCKLIQMCIFHEPFL